MLQFYIAFFPVITKHTGVRGFTWGRHVDVYTEVNLGCFSPFFIHREAQKMEYPITLDYEGAHITTSNAVLESHLIV